MFDVHDCEIICQQFGRVNPNRVSELLCLRVGVMELQITALDGSIIHITCTQGGFYVNGTRRDNFDPTPAANNPCHSHELCSTLLASNPSFAKVCRVRLSRKEYKGNGISRAALGVDKYLAVCSRVSFGEGCFMIFLGESS